MPRPGRAGNDPPIARVRRLRTAIGRAQSDERIFAGQDHAVGVGGHREFLPRSISRPIVVDRSPRRYDPPLSGMPPGSVESAEVALDFEDRLDRVIGLSLPVILVQV